MADIQDYIYHKKHETLLINPPYDIYILRINNRLVFKIKDEYKLEIQAPATMKLFGSTKKLIYNNNNNNNKKEMKKKTKK